MLLMQCLAEVCNALGPDSMSRSSSPILHVALQISLENQVLPAADIVGRKSCVVCSLFALQQAVWDTQSSGTE